MKFKALIPWSGCSVKNGTIILFISAIESTLKSPASFLLLYFPQPSITLVLKHKFL